MINCKRSRGFIALISVIIISFVLLLSAVTLNISGYFGRFSVLDAELKEKSSALAESCLETARLALAGNNLFTGSGEVYIDGNKCSYTVYGGENIKISSEVSDTFTYFIVKVNILSSKIDVLEFEECATLSTC